MFENKHPKSVNLILISMYLDLISENHKEKVADRVQTFHAKRVEMVEICYNSMS